MTGAVLVGLLLAAPAQADPLAVPGEVRRALHAASVEVLPAGCAGVVAASPRLVLTAAHCAERTQLQVRFTTGATRTARRLAIDEAADQSVLLVEDPVPVEPLSLVRRRPIPGTVLYFEGNPSRPRFQRVRVDRVGVCSSLPHLPDALFTSIRGAPGDSGAPLVDGAAEVVGLVHGGARCQIATPADTLVRLLDRVLEQASVKMTDAPPRHAILLACPCPGGASSRRAPRG